MWLSGRLPLGSIPNSTKQIKQTTKIKSKPAKSPTGCPWVSRWWRWTLCPPTVGLAPRTRFLSPALPFSLLAGSGVSGLSVAHMEACCRLSLKPKFGTVRSVGHREVPVPLDLTAVCGPWVATAGQGVEETHWCCESGWCRLTPVL